MILVKRDFSICPVNVIELTSFALIVYLCITLAFFPSVTYLSCLFILLFPIKENKRLCLLLTLIAVCFLILSLAITASSYQLFVYNESDFTSYYNNYLSFVDHGFNVESFSFGGGIEVGLPLLHYLLSKILGVKSPYLLVFVHSMIQSMLLMVLLLKIKRRWFLSFFEFSILISSAFLFYKYLGLLNHVRQGYASIFILMALYTNAGRQKSVLLTIAFFFHMSTILVYPLVNFLLKSNNRRKKRRFLIFVIVISITLFSSLEYLLAMFPPESKGLAKNLFYTMTNFSNNEVLWASFKYSLLRSIYFIPIIAVCLYTRKRSDICNTYFSNIMCLVVFLIMFAYLPSLASRLVEPILVLFIGVLYFRFMHANISAYRPFMGMIAILFFVKWWCFDSSFYSYYKLFSNTPFYYVDYIFSEREVVIRNDLPRLKDVEFVNRWAR